MVEEFYYNLLKKRERRVEKLNGREKWNWYVEWTIEMDKLTQSQK